MCHLLNFQKNLLIKHVTNKTINLKRRKCCNLFKPLIRGNIKYMKFNHFLKYCTRSKNEIKGSFQFSEPFA